VRNANPRLLLSINTKTGCVYRYRNKQRINEAVVKRLNFAEAQKELEGFRIFGTGSNKPTRPAA